MLNVAAVQTGNFCNRGTEYVTKLFDGVRKHMPAGVEWRAVCLTDDPSTIPEGIAARLVEPGINGWWNKLCLFKSGMFTPGERVLFFDLDTIICGDLSDIAAYRGKFGTLKDWLDYCRIASAMMAWEAGTADYIWAKWDEAGRPQFDPRGDQNWIGQMVSELDYLPDLFPGQMVSFKKDCWLQGRIPPDARVLLFHGHPRPHECAASFVRELWNPGWKLPARPSIDWASKTERWPLA